MSKTTEVVAKLPKTRYKQRKPIERFRCILRPVLWCNRIDAPYCDCHGLRQGAVVRCQYVKYKLSDCQNIELAIGIPLKKGEIAHGFGKR